VAVMFAPVLSRSETQSSLITIGTGGKSGVYYTVGGAICGLVNEYRTEHGIRCLSEDTEGSVYNLDAIRSGALDMALAQSDSQFNAYRGTGIFETAGPNQELRSIFSLYSEPLTVVTRPDTGIKHLVDLKGKKVSIGNPGSGSQETFEVLMAAMGWTAADFASAPELTVAEQARALCNKEVDAAVFIAGHPNKAILDMVNSCEAVLVDVTGPAVDALVAETPYYRPVTIPGGMYESTPEATQTFGLGATLVASTRTDARIVYELVKAVFENFDEFKGSHPALVDLRKDQMIADGLTAPLHEGAVRYYEESGLIGDE
jgi:hypothetical protein